jgi:amino acid adenylation domain-containing protein
VERDQLLYGFNDTSVSYPEDKTIVSLFEEQVARTPDAIALVYENKTITYKELDEKSNQFAHSLYLNSNIKKGDIVSVFLPKSSDAIISFLAILKLGAIYLPIDINYPKERIEYLINDSGSSLLITSENVENIGLNSIGFTKHEKQNLNNPIVSKDIAYLIYTSGSTGTPKGVMISHMSNINMAKDLIKTFGITGEDKLTWFASAAFDASIVEITMCLYTGATLCIPSEKTTKNKDEFVDFQKRLDISVALFPPSYLDILTNEDISQLRCIISAGETANPKRVYEIIELNIDYFNAYGPTECGVCVSTYKVTKNDLGRQIIPIGFPIANTKVYILDDALKLVPLGVTGTIYVAGLSLAKGYFNNPFFTTERFISNPFVQDEIIYNTGDLGCWLENGAINYLGRIDQQVKIRGYRIELGEIENTVLNYSESMKQVIVVKIENNDKAALVCYYVSDQLINKENLKFFLKQKLPDYMIPVFFIALDSLPITINGKIDRNALPQLTREDTSINEYIAPSTDIEKELVQIWEELLILERVGVLDDFFELGGNSLMVMRLINIISEKYLVKLDFSTIFYNPTIKSMAIVILELKMIAIYGNRKSKMII